MIMKWIRAGKLESTAPFRGMKTSSYTVCPLDTRRMVRAFETAGFTPTQAKVVTELFRDTLSARDSENRDQLASKGDYMQVKTELRILEKTDFQLLRSDVEHLETNIEKDLAGLNTELERIESRAIKYVLGSSFFLGICGYTLWFFYQHFDRQILNLSPDNYSDAFLPRRSSNDHGS